MKTRLFLLIIGVLLGIPPLQAQYFERSFQDGFYNLPTELRTADNGDLLFTVLNNQFLSLPTTLLYRIDSQGDTLHFPLFAQGIMLDADWLEIPGGYITTGYSFECDFPIPRYLTRYDTAGHLLWTRKMEFAGSELKLPMKLLPGPDSNFWIFRSWLPPILCNPAGDSIGVAPFAFSLFTGYEKNNGHLLTYGYTGLQEYQPDLNAVKIGLIGHTISKAATLNDGRVVALKKDRIILTDENFNILKEVMHGLTPEDFQLDLAVSDSNIRVLAATAPRKLLRYDLDLQLLEAIDIPSDKPFQPDFLSATADRVILLGHERGNSQVVNLRSTTANAVGLDAQPDAGLLEVTMPHLPVDYTFIDMIGQFHTIHFDSVSVGIQNDGLDTLQAVTLNAVLSTSTYICYAEDHFRKRFDQLQLAPGATTSLYVGNITRTMDFSSSQAELCFWTTLPNDSLDQNADNNKICNTFAVLVPADDPTTSVSRLQIIPNPASTACTVTWSGAETQQVVIQVINASGQQMIETTANGNAWLLERNNLAAGIYNVLIINEQGRRFAGKVFFN